MQRFYSAAVRKPDPAYLVGQVSTTPVIVVASVSKR